MGRSKSSRISTNTAAAAPAFDAEGIASTAMQHQEDRFLLDRKAREACEVELNSIGVVARFNGMIELADEIESIADRLTSPDASARAKKLADVYLGALKVGDNLGSVDGATFKLRLASSLACRVLEVLS